MELNRYKLGQLLELRGAKNKDLKYDIYDVKGISIKKVFIETKADMNGVSLKPYFLVQPDDFAYVTVTSRNGEKITLAHNTTDKTYIVSSSYVVFRVKRPDLVNSDYLFMYFNRPEFDRYSRFNSWGSARETFSWEDLCDVEIDLPAYAIQEKYVKVYKGMIANQESYAQGLEDLKLATDACIQKLSNCKIEQIGKYIEKNKKRNQQLVYSKEDVRGFNNEGEFIKPMRLFSGKLSTFKILGKEDFVYNSRINSTISKLSIAFNEENELIVSPAYESFYVKKTNELDPYYLYMLLQRENFARKVLFNSFGSSTLVFSLEDLSKIEIPLPDIKMQKSIANLYKTYKERRLIYEKLKEVTKDLCSILIKGALEEAKKED